MKPYCKLHNKTPGDQKCKTLDERSLVERWSKSLVLCGNVTSQYRMLISNTQISCHGMASWNLPRQLPRTVPTWMIFLRTTSTGTSSSLRPHLGFGSLPPLGCLPPPTPRQANSGTTCLDRKCPWRTCPGTMAKCYTQFLALWKYIA